MAHGVAKSRKSMESSRRLIPMAVCFLAFLLGAGTSSATTRIIASTGNVVQTASDGASHLIELAPGETSLEVVVPNNAVAAIYFSAECSVGAADATTWLDIDLLQDGVALTPTAGDNAFCSSNGVASVNGQWLSASADALTILTPGTYVFEVEAQLKNAQAEESWRIGETALVVICSEN